MHNLINTRLMTNGRKFFLVLNLIVGLPAFGFFILMVFIIMTAPVISEEDAWVPVVFTLSMLLTGINNFWNIYLVQHHWPDKPLSSAKWKINAGLVFINSVIAAALIVLCIAGLFDTVPNNDTEITIHLILILLGTLIDIVVLSIQARLPVKLRRKQQEKMRSMIDSIGE